MASQNPPIQLSLRTVTSPETPTRRNICDPASPPLSSQSSSPIAPKPNQYVPERDDDNECDRMPNEFLDEIDIAHEDSGRAVEFGRGVWSVVYMASSHPSSRTSSVLTPPSSPGTKSSILAVKTPARRDARSVLCSEAQMLTRLSRTPGNELYVVPFQGYVSSTSTIVMSGIPLALSTYIEEEANNAKKKPPSTRTIFDPIQGQGQWRDLAVKIISGLSWLHNTAHTVHGDIKPQSFLLRTRTTSSRSNKNLDNDDEFPYEPVFADFSSAHDLSSSSTATDNDNNERGSSSMSALTPPFAAPEFLSVRALTSPGMVPTTASDIFSLSVTLLAAATGDLLVYSGANNMQRLLMAREGHRLIEFARSGTSGTRVPRNGIVEQILKPAIAKDPAQRVSADAWLEIIQGLS